MGDAAPPPSYDPNSRQKSFTEMIGSVGGAASYNQPTAASGAGFKYDRETLQQLANEWSDMANEYKADIRQAEALVRAEGPGLDYASGGNAGKIQESGHALQATLRQRAAYCTTMATKYLDALGKYAKTEDEHTADIKNQGGTV